MNQERAILKGRLAELKETRVRLETGIQSNLSAVQVLLAGWRVRKFEDIDIDSAHHNLTEASKQKKELLKVRKDIKSIETELE